MKILSLLLFVLAACHSGHTVGGSDDLVGDPCTSDTDCAHRCYLDNNNRFPDGICSISCTSDQDCPVDTACVTTAGGVCLFRCPAFDCNFLGPQWRCDTRDRASGGQVDVCIGR
jgi:hypothetical protein